MSEHALITWLKKKGFGKYLGVNPGVQCLMSSTKKIFTFKLSFEVPKDDGVSVVGQMIDASQELGKLLITLTKRHKVGQKWILSYPLLTTADGFSVVSVIEQPDKQQKVHLEVTGEKDLWLFEVLTLGIRKL